MAHEQRPPVNNGNYFWAPSGGCTLCTEANPTKLRNIIFPISDIKLVHIIVESKSDTILFNKINSILKIT